MIHSPAKTPWYREPYVWLIITFPTIAVIGGMITLWLALQSHDGVVTDDYYKQGLEINRTLDRDKAAAAHGLSADMQFNVGDKLISIHFRSKPAYQLPDTIVLSFRHHTRQGFDQQVLLQRMDVTHYQLPLPDLVSGHWTVEVAGADWRLMRTVRFPLNMSRDFRLEPA